MTNKIKRKGIEKNEKQRTSIRYSINNKLKNIKYWFSKFNRENIHGI